MAQVAKQREQHSDRALGPAVSLGQGHLRLCMVCRCRGTASRMLALPALEGRRRLYCCLQTSCLSRLGQRHKALFRWPEQAFQFEHLQQLAYQQLLVCLGLMQRMGLLARGVQASQRLQQSCEQALVLMSQDSSERIRRSLRGQHCPLSAEVLGQALGQAPLHAVACPPGSLAERAAAWLELWYACDGTQTEPTQVPVEG